MAKHSNAALAQSMVDGATLFTLLIGVLVTIVGYSPLFLLLALFDIVAAIVVCVMARARDDTTVGGITITTKFAR